MSELKPIKVLIAAMGGEGGGVLMDWIVAACWRRNYPVQATSVPGVAQRTGATTYYIELLPEAHQPGDKRPVFALTPTPGEVDLMISTELAEAARAVGQGLVTPGRTTLIASTHRVYTTDEKLSLGDGRLDEAKLRAVAEKGAQRAILFNAAEAARRSGTVINAVILGAIAATNILKIDADEFMRAIEEEGKAVKSNLAGFRMGQAIATGERDGPVVVHGKRADPPVGVHGLDVVIERDYPEVAREVLRHGIRRLIDYQDLDYAKTYLARLEPFRSGDAALLREVARHLAVRMSYEDIVRVAQAKTRRSRFERIRGETGAFAGDVVVVTDFFKPGVPEFADMLPPALARRLIARSAAKGSLYRSGWAMHVHSTTITGFLKIRMLAGLKWWRPKSYRWSEENRAIEAWLALIAHAAQRDLGFAREVCDLARLIKGYGSTHRRGSINYARIVDALVVPELVQPTAKAAERIARARDAALKDPDGTALDLVLGETTQKLPRAAE
jgi:indolepyruvate ferredoxin oxidoreductase, beta subunit